MSVTQKWRITDRCPPSTQQDYTIEEAGRLTNKQITTWVFYYKGVLSRMQFGIQEELQSQGIIYSLASIWAEPGRF